MKDDSSFTSFDNKSVMQPLKRGPSRVIPPWSPWWLHQLESIEGDTSDSSDDIATQLLDFTTGNIMKGVLRVDSHVVVARRA